MTEETKTLKTRTFRERTETNMYLSIRRILMNPLELHRETGRLDKIVEDIMKQLSLRRRPSTYPHKNKGTEFKNAYHLIEKLLETYSTMII